MRTSLAVPIVLRRVTIHGPSAHRQIDMILDTGAVYTLVAWDVLKDIGYDPAVSQQRIPIVTANGVIEVPLVMVERVELAELSAESIDVICHDIPEIIGVEGLLGLSFLRHFRVLMDYPGPSA